LFRHQFFQHFRRARNVRKLLAGIEASARFRFGLLHCDSAVRRRFGIENEQALNLFYQTVTLYNPTTRPIQGPIALLVDGLDRRIKLKNKVGTVGTSQFVLGFLQGSQLDSLQGETFVLIFRMSRKLKVNYTLRFVAGFNGSDA
jgi:hypothetical protein